MSTFASHYALLWGEICVFVTVACICCAGAQDSFACSHRFEVLMTLFNATGGNKWRNQTGWGKNESAEWYGVTCSTSLNDVTQLYLFNNNLNGTLPECLQNLSNLNSLELDFNILLVGIIPHAWRLSLLPNLTLLSAMSCSLSGTLPESQSPMKMRSLRLSGNSFTGTLPASWGYNMRGVEEISCRGCVLSGTLPSEWSRMRSLRILSLESNRIFGSLPERWANMSSLSSLTLNNNQLNGTLPKTWGFLLSITGLGLSFNKLTGSLPGPWSTMSNLQTVFVDNNLLTGTVPPEWGTLSNVTQMRLNMNCLRGTIPQTFSADLRARLYICNTKLVNGIIHCSSPVTPDCFSASGSIEQSTTLTFSASVISLSNTTTTSNPSSCTMSLPVPLVASTGDAPLPAQIGSNVATAASLVTGSDTSNIVMMSMLSLLSCEGRPSALGTTTNTVSLFFTLGGWQMAVGNLGLVLAILIAHVTATSFLSWRRGTSFPTECHGVVRFPSMSITTSEFLLPGSTYGAVMVLTSTDSDVGELAACIMCIVVIVGTIAVRQAFLVQSVLPNTQWELYLHRPVDVWDAKLYPIGRWSPKGMRNSFGSLIGPMKRRFASYRIVESILSLLIAAAAGAGGQSGEYVCRSLVFLVGILCAVVALLCALTRPYRFPMDRFTTPLVHLLFSVVCFLKASKANAVIVSWIQVVQSVVLVWKNVWMVWISLREAMWEDEADANDEDKEQGGDGIIRTIVAALWFGGGGLGTSRNNTQFTRIARTEEEELADWLSDDVLQRDVSGINIGDQLMAPLVQGPNNDEDIFQPKDTVDLMSCSSHSSEEDAPPPIHEDDVDVEGVIQLRVEDKPPVVNNTAKTDFFVGIEGYYMS